MPSLIKHMDKMHKISLVSNFKQPIVSAFWWLSFIVQNLILKKFSYGIALKHMLKSLPGYQA